MTRRSYPRRIRIAAVLALLFGGASALPAAAQGTAVAGAPLMLQESSSAADDGNSYTYSIVTAPPLQGIDVELDGVVKTTGADGTTTFEVQKVDGRPDRTIGERVTVLTQRLEIDDKIRANFSLARLRSTSLALQYTIDYLVSFRYRDSSGERMPPSAVGEVQLKSSVGEERGIEPGIPVWLLGTRAAPAPLGLFDIKPVFWTVQDVVVDGLSVANRSQTKFYPEETFDVEVPLLFFSARFEVVDAFFGFPIGDTIELTSPAGTATIHELDQDGTLSLDQLARGEYTVLVQGPGLKLPRPVAVSRNQTVALKLYSWLDLGVVAAVLLSFMTVPVLYGFRRRKRLAIAGRLPTGTAFPTFDPPVEPTTTRRSAATSRSSVMQRTRRRS